MRLLCRLGWHRFRPWRRYGGGVYVWECLRCNEKKEGDAFVENPR